MPEESIALEPGMVFGVKGTHLSGFQEFYKILGISLGGEDQVNLVELLPLTQKGQLEKKIHVPYSMVLNFIVYKEVEIR